MKRILCTGALLALATVTTACGFKIFEDIGSNPHPPAVGITSISVYVAPEETTTTTTTTTADASPEQARSTSWDSGGFTLKPGQTFQIGITYADSGGDIERFSLRDRDGATTADLTPADQTYFPGTSGTVLLPEAGQELTGVAGRHRLLLWAEDSHGGRSEQVEFVITFNL